MESNKQSLSLGELFGQLSTDMSFLVRQEIELAKTEMTEKATKAGKNVGFMIAGAAVAYMGVLVLLAAATIGLGQFLDMWLSALIIGLIVTAIGTFLMQKGMATLQEMEMTPQKTVESLKEDKEWLQQHTP